MDQSREKLIRRGAFHKVAFSSSKKLVCDRGELVLTSERLSISCEGSWSRSFPIWDIRLEGWDKYLEVRDFYWGRLQFRLVVDDAQEWIMSSQKIHSDQACEMLEKIKERNKKKPEELNRLFDINQENLRGIVKDIRKWRLDFGEKNIHFVLNVQRLATTTNNRKLKAFLLAHCYVAWYEWTKVLLLAIYKGKRGKGPNNDDELIKFLGENFPSLQVLDTREWGIGANQIRNCVAHEKFYYDYKRSELVLNVNSRNKRISLRELERRFHIMTETYSMLVQCLKQKVETGKVRYKSESWT
jgi:hypothetical protein